MNFTRWISLAFVLLLFWTPATQAGNSVGYVDQVTYDRARHSLTVSGWAASENPYIFVTNLIAHVNGNKVYQGRMLRAERPDVAEAYSRKDWLASGFSVQINLPQTVSNGPHSLLISARLSNGHDIVLPATPGADRFTVEGYDRLSTRAKWSIALALLLCVATLLGAPGLNKVLQRWQPPILPTQLGPFRFGISLGLAFAILVGTGATGTSLALLTENSAIAEQDGKPWLGEARPIRSDEWEVITPMAISQLVHEPKFPVVNTHWGSDGHNMLVVGMTGVPVTHVSALAKPATWGFFLLDTRQALAWYWWFPFFSCFAALWQVLRRFFDLEWRVAAGLAAAFSWAPYVVVFSAWPAYTAFFPLAGILAARRVVQSERMGTSIASGALLGLSVAGFALVLYPAWQVSLAYLLLPFFAAWCWSHRRQLRFGGLTLLGLAVATALALLILGSWWLDARDAVAIVQNTVYPGQRTVEAGGDIDRWYFIKGLLSLQTMYRTTALMDPSDAGSFLFFPIALAMAALAAFRTDRQAWVPAAVVMAFAIAVTAYIFVGFGEAALRPPLWGMVTSYRLDLALALAQVLLMGWLFSRVPFIARTSTPLRLHGVAIATAGASLLWGAWLYRLLPTEISTSLLSSVVLVSLLAWAGLSYWIVVKQYAAATVMLCAWTFAIALPFNPLGQAPSHTTLDPALQTALVRAQAQAGHAPNIAVIEERTWSLLLPMTGWQVSNSVFYAPPLAFWKLLDPDGSQAAIYNRYQRLFFRLGDGRVPSSYTIHSPRLDEVVLTLDPKDFHFNRLGSDLVLSPARYRKVLSGNRTLDYLDGSDQWSLFRIKPQTPP